MPRHSTRRFLSRLLLVVCFLVTGCLSSLAVNPGEETNKHYAWVMRFLDDAGFLNSTLSELRRKHCPNCKSGCDVCCGPGAICVKFGCIDISMLCGRPSHEDLPETKLALFSETPTLAVFSPEGLVAARAVGGELLTVSENDQVTLKNPDGNSMVFTFDVASPVGIPTGAYAGSHWRLEEVEENGTVVAYELYTLGSQSRIRYSAQTKKPLFWVLPGGRRVAPEDTAVEIVNDQDGIVKQVKTPWGLAVVGDETHDAVGNPTGYTVSFYAEADVTGGGNGTDYTLATTASPHTKVTIANPSEDTTDATSIALTRRIYESGIATPVQTYTHLLEYVPASKSWALTEGEDQDERAQSVRYEETAGSEVRREITEVRTSDNELLSATTRDILRIGADNHTVLESRDTGTVGEEIWEKYVYYGPEDTDHTVATTYADNHGLARTAEFSNGSWTVYDYDQYRRRTLVVYPWKDQTWASVQALPGGINDAAIAGHSFHYDYTPHETADTVGTDARPRTVTEKVAGTAVARTYYAHYANASGEQISVAERAGTPSAAYGATGNLRTTVTRYAPTADSASAGRTKTIAYPDGRQDSFSYDWVTYVPNATPSLCACTTGGTDLRSVVTHGTSASPAGIANRTTREVSVERPNGDVVLSETYVYDGMGYERVAWTVREMDAQGHVTASYESDSTEYRATWGCCGRDSETLADGTQYAFVYDSLSRLDEITKECGDVDLVTAFTQDAAGRTLTSTVQAEIAPGTFTSLTSATAYDMADRPVRQQAPDRRLHLASFEESARRTEVTYPGGGVETQLRYIDGRIKSVTGTAVTDTHHDYGVDTATGQRWSIVYTGAIPANGTFEDIPRWSKTWTDALGRPIRTEKPTTDSAVIAVSQAYYNSLGQLVRTSHGSRPATGTTVTPFQADTLLEYDALGQLSRSGMDADGSGSLTLASTDRIRETETVFEQDAADDWWLKTTESTYLENNSSTRLVARIGRRRLTGLGTAAPAPYGGTLVAEHRDEDVDGNVTVTRSYLDRASKTAWTVVDSPFSSTDAYTKTVNGLVVESVSSTGVLARTLYDELERVVATTDPRISTYDAGTGEWSNTSQTHYNTLGQVDWTRGTAGNQTTYAYDTPPATGTDQKLVQHHGRAIAVTNALGKVRRLSYNVRGQVERTWGDTEYPQELSHDEFGRLVAMSTYRAGTGWSGTDWPAATAGTADVTTWTYEDATGLLAAKTYADNTGPSYEYDAAGRTARRTWERLVGGNPLTTDYTYESVAGQVASVDYSDSTPDLAYVYGRPGHLASVTDATGTRTFSYGTTGKLASEAFPSAFYGTGVSLQPTYDTVGRYDGYDLYVGGTVAESAAHAFDATDRHASVASGNDTFAYGYVTGTDLPYTTSGPANMLRTLSYEPLRNVVASVENTIGANTVSKFEYTHDAVYRRTHAVFSGSAFTTAVFARYTHNDRDELTAAAKFQGTDTTDETNPVPIYDYAFGFDPIGNRLTSSTAETGTTVGTTYTADQLNQYTSIVQAGTPPITVTPAHDADGNQTTLDNASGSWTLEWDAENRLVTATSETTKVECVYDYRSRRVEKRVSTSADAGQTWTVSQTRRFLYDGWLLIAEFDHQAETNSLKCTHLWGLDLSGTLEGAGGIGGLLRTRLHETIGTSDYYPTYDANGNVSEYVDSSGTVVAHYEYGPFGNVTAATGTMADSFAFRFSTKYLDAETALWYYGYRYYDATNGRWLSRDPLGEEGGVNLYAFVVNNPVDLCEALGLMPRWVMNLGYRAAEARDFATEFVKAAVVGSDIEYSEDDRLGRAAGVVAVFNANIESDPIRALQNTQGAYMEYVGEPFARKVAQPVLEFCGAGRELLREEHPLYDSTLTVVEDAWNDEQLMEQLALLGLLPLQFPAEWACAKQSLQSFFGWLRYGRKPPHRNSLAYKGETHVYRVKSPDGTTHKIGESAQGTRVRDGASIRAEKQVRKLNRTVGPGHSSEIRKVFPTKAKARKYETRLIERFRRIFGQDKLPGNKTNR